MYKFKRVLFMTISNKISRIALAAIIVVSLCMSAFFLNIKQGYHEDELLTYNLANSSKQLNIGGWSTPDDMNEYLAVYPGHRFDYAQVVQNQIIDASHPPFYYALVHTVCSFFPEVFSKWLAFVINLAMMAGALIMLFKIGKRVTDNNLYALIATGGYALSIACITTTIYLRMYASLTFFVLTFINLTIWFYEQKKVRLWQCAVLLPVVILGILTQYYFILCAGLTGLVYMIFSIKDKKIRNFLLYAATAFIGAGIAMAIYPHIIQNVLGGNRGLGSLNLSIDAVTIVTYVFYKIGTYIQVLSKDLFLNQIWLFALCAGAALGFGVFMRFVKKKKLPRKAFFIVVPGLVYFIGISLVSPFNSDRYVMASLPLISMMFTFMFIRVINFMFKNKKLGLAVPVCALLASVIGFLTVQPYYIYGKTNLYEPQTKDCVFVGTAMLEWNKCIDKFMLYDNTMILQTTEMSKTLAQELETFANDRGVITNGKITAFADAYMNNGDVDRKEADTLKNFYTDERLKEDSEVTVYISRLADSDTVIDGITSNTEFKHYELIQADYSFDEFYNWYDYFVETESYCNVYRFYK